MGSFFTKIPGRTIKGFAGNDYPLEFYIQFVPGIVVDVVYSSTSLRYAGENTINTIIAKPHITDKPYVRNSNLGEDNRYYPLLRGMTEVPVKGDPVILCTMGKINYYLGPVNSNSNNPTWNDDMLNRQEIDLLQESVEIPISDLDPTSDNFNKDVLYKRLSKMSSAELDFGPPNFETTGDYIIEGRHGNSIRVGSRSDNPYIYLSNERGPDNIYESITDGSLIGITSHGTLQHHFGGELVPENESLAAGESRPDGRSLEYEAEIKPGFILSSDTLQEPNRFMGTLVSNVNNNQDVQDLIYLYGSKKEEELSSEVDPDAFKIKKGENANQILINSDRITINTKIDDIYLSSIKDIHIGTGRHLTISTNQDLIISSERTFIGNPTDREDTMESMVLGTTLLELLKETLAVIKSSQGMCQGAPIPLVDATMGPLSAKITQIEQKIDQILSTKHFIEPNA